MEWISLDDDGEIEFVSEEVKLVPELQNLLSLKYNKGPKDADGRKRIRAKQELKYLYLAYSSKSPYRDYYKEEKIAEARSDCEFDSSWKESPELTALIEKFSKGPSNKTTRSLQTVEEFLEKFEKHLKSVDLNERTSAGTIVHDPSKIMNTLKSLPDFLITIKELERQAKNDTIRTVKSKGDHELGWMATAKPVRKENEE